MIIIDDTALVDTFELLDKYEKHPKTLTRKERKHLKELGITLDQNTQ